MSFADVNYLAVLVAAVAYFALGGLWYAPPVFGRAWMKASGIQMREGERPGAAIYILPFFAGLVAALATALLGSATAVDTVGEGIALGLLVGVVALSVTLTTAAFDPQKPQPGVWFMVTGLYHLVGLVLVGVIVALWR